MTIIATTVSYCYFYLFSSMKEAVHSLPQAHIPGDDDDDVETGGSNKKTHYRGNTKKAGYIVYTVSIGHSYSYCRVHVCSIYYNKVCIQYS